MSKRTRRNNSRIFILALILLVPGFLYIALNRFGSNEYVSLPVFGEKKLSGEMNRKMGREIPDTIFHTLDEIRFHNQDGAPVTIMNKDTVMRVVHLFYTRDQSFSRLMADNMHKLAVRFQQMPTVRLYSLSVDPADSSSQLTEFVKPYPDFSRLNWSLLSQPSRDIFAFANNELLIDGMVDPADSSRFLLGNQIVLIDSKQRIRGFYNISLKGVMDRLEDEIRLQLVEEIRENRIKKVEQQ